jgi:hypothetical protein
MEIPPREQLERRLHAQIADHLDRLAEENTDGFDPGQGSRGRRVELCL